METRLIDANALMERICGHECGMHPEDCDGMESETVPCNFHAYVSEAPTIDAHPVKHGLWSECWRDPVRNVMSVICSACGDASIAYLPKRDLVVDDVPKKICIQMPYCPKCSAKMDGGDTDA